MNPIMSIILQMILWLSISLLVYSYVIFPLILNLLSRHKKKNPIVFQKEETLPHVSILMSLFNEEQVIIDKLNTLIQQNYPPEQLDVYIGSDHSSDQTNMLVESFISKHHLSNFHFFPYTDRQGKPGVINQLVERAKNQHGTGKEHILIITDASVLLDSNTVFQLIKHFKNDQIGLVDSHMQHIGLQKEGISQSEDQYISGEVHIKHMESILNGKMMGPFGGCYAIRSDLFTPVPHNFLVDDFYLAMHVLNQGKNAINELDAICSETVSHEIHEEYRRKKRISAGNFQNLNHYKHLLLPSNTSIAFNFWGHKLIRWLGPFLIILSFLSNLFLGIYGNLFYIILLSFQTVLIFIIPIFDIVLQQFNIHIIIMRSIRYFFIMNLALLEGFINYLKGIKSNVWQPTKRPNSTQ